MHQDGENPAVVVNRHCLRRPPRRSARWSAPVCRDPARWAQTANLASPAPAKTARSSEFSGWARRADALANANEAASAKVLRRAWEPASQVRTKNCEEQALPEASRAKYQKHCQTPAAIRKLLAPRRWKAREQSAAHSIDPAACPAKTKAIPDRPPLRPVPSIPQNPAQARLAAAAACLCRWQSHAGGLLLVRHIQKVQAPAAMPELCKWPRPSAQKYRPVPRWARACRPAAFPDTGAPLLLERWSARAVRGP